MIKKILFRADSSFLIGTGHIMRDLVLASQYSKANITFATQELEGNINYKISESGYKLKKLKSNKLKELNKLIKKLNIDMIVIDHYSIDYTFEKKLKEKNPHLIILTLDDTYEKHYCDILLNHNMSADKKKYKGLVPKYCELKCGSKYTLLREEFYREKKKKKKIKSEKNKSIFIAMGGADHSNINIDILKVIKKFLKKSKKDKNNIKVNLVTTNANKNLNELKKYSKNKSWIKLHINSNKIAELMRKSDFAIVTPSVTVNEVYFMNLPFIAIKTAENQNDIYEYLQSNRFNVIDEFSKKVLCNLLKEHFLYNIKLVDFTKLKKKEKQMILEWRNDSSIRKWMYNQTIIPLKSHFAYIDSLKESKDKKYFLVKKNDKYIGVIDFANIKKESVLMGLYANPESKGVGKVLLENILNYACNILKVERIFAEVFSGNIRAYKLYKEFNFKSLSKKIINNKEVICLELKNENR